MKLISRRNAFENKGIFKDIKIKNTKISIEKIRLLNSIDAEIKIYEELIKPSEELAKYEEKRIEIVKKYGQKDESGELKIFEGGTFKIVENIESFKEEIFQLENENKPLLEEVKKIESEVSEWLNEEFFKSEIVIKEIDLPSDLIDEDISAILIFADIE